MFATMTTSCAWQERAACTMPERSAAVEGSRLASGVRFIASGCLNTAATWTLYAVLLRVLPYQLSYTIAYIAGIALAYLLYRHFVFRRKGGRFAAIWVAAIYLFQYLFGLALVHVWVRVLGGPQLWAPIFSVLLSIPLTYALNRWVFRPRAMAGVVCAGTPDP